MGGWSSENTGDAYTSSTTAPTYTKMPWFNPTDGTYSIHNGTAWVAVSGGGFVTNVNATGLGDESDLIQSCIDVAGVGGVLQFNKNITITIGKRLNTLQNQTLINASFLRANKIESTTTSAVIANNSGTGSVTISVVDSSIFALGDQVTLSSGYHLTNVAIINNIAGNNIAVTTALSCSSVSMSNSDVFNPTAETNYTFPIGSYVTKNYGLIKLSSGCTLQNCTIDGNKASWETGGLGAITWDRHFEILASDIGLNNVSVNNCTIKNFAGEAVLEAGGGSSAFPTTNSGNHGLSVVNDGWQWGTRYINNNILNGGGNGIHLSSVNGALITGNCIDNVNQNYGVRHTDGAIAFSFSGRYVKISNNTIRRSFRGVGSPYCIAHSQVVISGNSFIACKNAGIRMSSSGYFPSDITITENLFQDCSLIAIRNGGGLYMDGVTIANNEIYGNVQLAGISKLSLSGGFIDMTYIPQVQITTSTITLNNSGAVTLPVGAYFGGSNPATTNYAPRLLAVGDEVILTQNGVQSGRTYITTVAGTQSAPTYTLAYLDTSFSPSVGNPVFVSSAKFKNVTCCSTTIVFNTTQNITVRDATLFNVGDFVVLDQVSSGATTSVNEITAINYATCVVTFKSALTGSGTFVAPTTNLTEIRMYRQSGGSSNGCITVMDATGSISANTISGGYSLMINGTCSPLQISGTYTGARAGGVICSNVSSYAETLNCCTIRTSAAFSMSWYEGIRMYSQVVRSCDVLLDSNVTSGGGGSGIHVQNNTFMLFNNTVRCLGNAATFNFTPTNLFLTPATPATQSITVSNGKRYTIDVVGSGSITLSGAATGAVIAGTPLTVLATTTTLTCTVTGSLTLARVVLGSLGAESGNFSINSSMANGVSNLSGNSPSIGLLGYL